jgi:hypothetical protein
MRSYWLTSEGSEILKVRCDRLSEATSSVRSPFRPKYLAPTVPHTATKKRGQSCADKVGRHLKSVVVAMAIVFEG